MYPWLVSGNQTRCMGPVTCVAVLQLLPPFVDEMKPTSSLQVEVLQLETG